MKKSIAVYIGLPLLYYNNEIGNIALNIQVKLLVILITLCIPNGIGESILNVSNIMYN